MPNGIADAARVFTMTIDLARFVLFLVSLDTSEGVLVRLKSGNTKQDVLQGQ